MYILFPGSAMNNCRAGLYSFASTTTWLRKMGTASPPYLVILGLILPDSRMLSGIASIGLTLANIAIILPYLRQSLLDSMQACEGAPTHAGGQMVLFPDESHPTQLLDLGVETLPLTSASPCSNEHPSSHVARNASANFPLTVELEPLDVNPGAAPFPILPLPSGKTELRQSDQPPDDATERLASSNPLLTRDGRSALYIPLPVPDVAEIAFFDSAETLTSNLDLDLEEVSAEQDTLLEEDSSMEDDELIAIENCQPLTSTELLSPPKRILGQGFAANGEIFVPDEYVAYIQTILPRRSVRLECSEVGEDEDFAKQRHESLKFIPQSVLSRYPTALVVSAGRCNEYSSIGFGRDNRIASLSIGHNLGGISTPEIGNITSEACWRAAFVADVRPEGQLIGGQTLVLDVNLGQDRGSLSEPRTLQDLTTPKKYPTQTKRRRLGVLARAALRNRRFSARRCRGDENDDSSASNSDSDSDSSDSQYSSGSSVDSESMLPLMLGADLLAALDANSESELNPAGPGRRCSVPLTVYEELFPDGSVADISIVMQVSSINDSTDGEAKAPVTLRSLTHEDIQQWASGVVQKCVRQVCRARAPADPLQSPSQASDVCAEKPSGSGTSQCPFSGLHCKLGAGSSGHGKAPRANEFPPSLPPTLILPARKIRNIRDIPEFIPRQRLVSVTTGRVEGHWMPDTRSTNMDVARAAADKVIARVETQARFNSRQCLVGVDKRKVNTATHGSRKNV